MKYIILTLIMASLTTSVAYGQKKPSLSGKWVLQYTPSVIKMSPELKQHFNAKSSLFRDKIKKSYQGRTYSFFGNGSYVQTLADGRSVTGNWKLDKTGLRMIDKSGGILSFTILSFTNTTLVIKANESNRSKLFLSQWYLTKIN